MRHRRSFFRAEWLAWACAQATVTLAVAQEVTRSPRSVLYEIVVTATRVQTNLQQTPMSLCALSGEQLKLAGVDSGRDLGIMLPNVVINPGPVGEAFTNTTIRGLPGVTTYVDGIWVDNLGFLQRGFVELEREN